jgi:hypothetical protein
MKTGQIRHMVIFCLTYAKDSAEIEQFLKDGEEILSSIPTVQDFEVLKQISSKNDYDYGFSMVFENQADYDTYNNHPKHVSFVKERWMKEVTRFLEIDFTN